MCSFDGSNPCINYSKCREYSHDFTKNHFKSFEFDDYWINRGYINEIYNTVLL